MTLTSPVRIAVIGAGVIGRRHIGVVRNEPGAELVAIVDPAPPAKALADSLGVAWAAEADALLRGDKPEAVIIATPNQLHVTGALTFVSAGIPVLLEKPVADSVAEAMRLVEAAEATGVPILIGHHRRHSTLINEAKAVVGSGRLSRITAVNALSWFYKPSAYFDVAWRREAGGGPVLINLIHVIDDLRNMVGDVTSVQAIESNAVRGFAVEDTAAVLLRFANGALGTVTVSDTTVAPWSWEMTSGEDRAFPSSGEASYMIGGTDGSLTVPRLDHWHYGETKSWVAPISRDRCILPEQDPLLVQLRHFCAVARRKAKPVIDAREGTRTLAVTLAVKRSSEIGQAVRI